MTYSLSCSPVGDVLELRISGERPAHDSDYLSELWDFWSDAAERCRREGLSRVLIVSDASGPMSSSAAVAFYGGLDQSGFERSTRIAVVITDAKARKIIQLGVAIATDKGWAVQLFESEREARSWTGPELAGS